MQQFNGTLHGAMHSTVCHYT
eukprot:COSAG06_NODE_15507_length_1066_cov_1.109617_2_plen_20_part_01